MEKHQITKDDSRRGGRNRENISRSHE
jgi:hypothetical protein